VTQRETLIEKLTDSNEELERFAHVCSHDLHEPLRMVKSFTEILELHLNETMDVDEQTQQYMGDITNGAKRGKQLVNDVLAYSKVSKDDSAMETVNRKRCIDHTWVLIFHGSKASILDCLCLLTIAVSVFVIYW
jgi:light-regulated signal transduction histidine kinase (bacteriophytochrome)